ncbi:plasmid mobilization protein [Paracidovorax citrulli]
MYVRDKSRPYTGQKHSVASGPLRASALSVELRAPPRDPCFEWDKKMGNKASTRGKTARFELRLTPEDKQAIEEKAAQRKLTIADYLVRSALGRAARQRADVDTIHQLMLCVEKLKEIHQTLREVKEGLDGPTRETMESTMQAVCDAIHRVWTHGGAR